MLRRTLVVVRRGVRESRSGSAAGGLGAAGVFAGQYQPSTGEEKKSGLLGGAGANNDQLLSQSLDGFRQRAVNDGARELGLTKEEFEARKIRATSPYKVKREKGGEISILSSARASQIMTEGAIERTSTRETAEMTQRKKYLRWFNVFMVVTGLTSATFVALAWLKPVLDLRTKRYRQQKRRHEEFFLPALEALEREKEQERQMLEAAAKAGVVVPGASMPPAPAPSSAAR